MPNDISQTVRLTAYEAALISQPIMLDMGLADAPEQVDAVFRTQAKPAELRLLRPFLLFALAVYALIVCIQAMLDLEYLNSRFPSQLAHYAVAYFWLNVSAAMLLTAWVAIEKVQVHLPGMSFPITDGRPRLRVDSQAA